MCRARVTSPWCAVARPLTLGLQPHVTAAEPSGTSISHGDPVDPYHARDGGARTKAGALSLGGFTSGANSAVNANLTVTTLTSGAATFNSTLAVSGATNLNTLAVSGTLGVTGATALSTLSVSGAATFNSTLAVSGATTLASLSVSGATTLNTLAVTGSTTLSGGVVGNGQLRGLASCLLPLTATQTCTFVTALPAAPASVVITPATDIGPAVRYHVSALSATTFSVTFDVAPLVPQQFYYVVIQ